jgi:hypothetical protein
MRDLTRIRESFAATLRSMMHNRISYTKAEESEDRKAASGTLVVDTKTGSESSVGRVAMTANRKPV